MAMYFAASTCSFFDSEIIEVSQMPEDKVVVTDARYNELLTAQANGSVIIAAADGTPTSQAQACSPCSCLTHDLVKATASQLGHVKIGAGVNVAEDGTISTGRKVDFVQADWTYSSLRYRMTVAARSAFPIVQVYKLATDGVTAELVTNVNVTYTVATGALELVSMSRFDGFVVTL